ncbi:MAG: GntP family permease [Luminiphilus sp.]|nr:GntP family permease [Luminiphilus sp.]
MSDFVGYAGLLASVFLLIWLALRGIDIIFAALLSAIVIILTNQLAFAESLLSGFALGKLGAFTFAGKFFLLFAAGAIFGRVMGDSGAAASVALALIRRMGAEKALIVTTLSCALLTYGGVVVFVVIFAMYPLGLQLLKEANIPKRLFCAALALGAGTFTLTALPGTPSIQNVISATALNTSLFAAPWLGMIGGITMFALGLWYLETQRRLAHDRAEGFEPGPRDQLIDVNAEPLPHWVLAVSPLVVVLGTIMLPRFFLSAGAAVTGSAAQLLEFANNQPVVWPSVALLLGSVQAALLFPRVRYRALLVMGRGTQDAILPLINTAAVIGFAGVVTQTQGFQTFLTLAIDSGLPPLLSVFGSISLISAITGSASGGLQIFMQTLGPQYLEMGLEPEVLHRVATIASGGFDSLPHCGAVVAMLTITQLTHKQAYRDVGVITVVIPVIATLVTIGAASLGIR